MNIQDEIKTAMKTKDTVKLAVLRQLKTEFTNASLRKGNATAVLSDIEKVGIIRKEISKRMDSWEAYNDAGRVDLAKRELEEHSILEFYLPEEMSDEQLESIVDKHITDLKAETKRDMGKVIKSVLVEVAGQADNKKVSQMIGSKLS